MLYKNTFTNRVIIFQDDHCWGKQKDKVLVGYKSSWMRMSLLGCHLSPLISSFQSYQLHPYLSFHPELPLSWIFLFSFINIPFAKAGLTVCQPIMDVPSKWAGGVEGSNDSVKNRRFVVARHHRLVVASESRLVAVVLTLRRWCFDVVLGKKSFLSIYWYW